MYFRLHSFILAVIVVFGASKIYAADFNLLANGNFEQYMNNGTIPKWQPLGTLSSLSQTETNAKFGKYCLKFDNNTGSSAGIISDFITVAGGAKYRIQANLLQSDSKQIALYYWWYDANQQKIGSTSGGLSTIVGSWARTSYEAQAPEDAVYVRIILWHYGWKPGSAYIDGVSFCRAGNQSLVDNSDFTVSTPYSGVPVGWQKAWGTDFINAATYDGRQAVYIYDYSALSSCAVISNRYMSVKPQMKYTISAKLRTETLTAGNRGAVYLYFYDQNKNRITNATYSMTATPVSDNGWETRTMTVKAPSGAAYAKILLTTFSTAKVKSWFDDIEMTKYYSKTVYMAYNAAGNGSGDTPANAARISDSAIWSTVRDELAMGNPVKVVLLEGNYNISDDTRDIIISDMNLADSACLFITGEYIYGTEFLTGSNVSVPEEDKNWFAFELKRCLNTTLQNIHFTDIPATYTRFHKMLGISGDYIGKNITIQGCSFIDLENVTYSIIAPSSGDNYRIQNCEFIRTGDSSLVHNIYAANGTNNTIISDNYFEDCSGDYVRFRNRCADNSVSNNSFISTGTWYGTHKAFIEMFCVANDVNPGDESYGNFGICRIENNIFKYQGDNGLGQAWPIYIVHMGYDPAGESYLLDAADKNTLENGSSTAVSDLLFNHYGIRVGTNFIISGNSYINEYGKLYLKSYAAFGAVNKGGDGYYNLDILL